MRLSIVFLKIGESKHLVRTQKHYPNLGTKERAMESNNSFYSISFNVLRTLTTVRDEEGKVKISQFGSCWEEDNPNCVNEQISFFKNFVSSTDSILTLRKNIGKIAFFSEQEYSDYTRGLRKGNKTETEYEEEFMDSSVGVYILEKAKKFSTKTRLVSCYKHVDDAMFSSMRFFIDFQSNTAKIVSNRDEVFSCELPMEKKKVVKKEEPIPAEQPKKRGRPKKVTLDAKEEKKQTEKKKTTQNKSTTSKKRSSDLW